MIRTHRAGEGLGRCGEWGLGSTEPKGARHASHLGSQKAGNPTWEPSRLPGPEWVGPVPSPPVLLPKSCRVPPLPPASPALPQPPSYAPRTHAARRGFWRAGDQAWALSRFPRLEWAGPMPSAPPAPPVLEGPSPHLSCSPLASLLRPKDQ